MEETKQEGKKKKGIWSECGAALGILQGHFGAVFGL